MKKEVPMISLFKTNVLKVMPTKIMTVEINIRAFCSEFPLKVRRKTPMTIDDAIRYVNQELEWDTAEVKSIRQNGRLIKNKNVARA